MAFEFVISDFILASPQEIYHTWLDSVGHKEMTGSPARASAQVGGEFEAWDGYISGHNLELEPGKRIMQAWRTSEFGENEPDSLVEVSLVAEADGTRLTIQHSNLPDNGEQYRQGWIDFYFQPMKEYFRHVSAGRPPEHS